MNVDARAFVVANMVREMKPYRRMARFSLTPIALVVATVGVGLVAVGCKACDKDQPYVPYTVDPNAALGTGTVAPPPSADAKQPEEPANFAPVLARRVNAASVNTLAGPITAPAGGNIEWLLEGDVTGDDKPDAIAWVRTADASTGQLVHFSRAYDNAPLKPRTLVGLPSDMALSGTCKAAVDLKQVGRKTVFVSVMRICSKDESTTVNQWFAAVSPTRDPVVRMAFFVDQPSEDNALEFTFDASDRDGDSLDDLLVTVQMSAPPAWFDERGAENPAVVLRYFDRPAGLSRDPQEPSRSFAAIVQRLKRLAKGKQRELVAPEARSARLLYQLLCAESSRAKVRTDVATVSCGVKDMLGSISLAEIDASIGANNTLSAVSAVGAFERMRLNKASEKDLQQAKKTLEGAFPARNMDSYYLPFGPTVVPSGVTWGPLAFHTDGALLIRTDTSVLRFDPKGRVALADPESGPITPWDLRVVAPDGVVAFAGVEDRCRGGLAVGKLLRGRQLSHVLLPMDPLDSGACAGDTPRFVDTSPLVFFAGGLSLIAGDSALYIATDASKAVRQAPMPAPAPYGSSRSPDGKWFAKASSLGVLVVGDNGAGQLVRSATMQNGYEKLKACTVANGATAVACCDGTTTRVFVMPR